MDGTRIADLDELSTDDTHLFRVRVVDGSGDGTVASGAAALESDERTAAGVDGPGPGADGDSGVDGPGPGADGDSGVDGDGSADGATADSDGSADGATAEGPIADDDIAYPDDHGSDADADVREAILLRLADEDGDGGETGDGDTAPVACWLNYCQHMTHIKLDKGSGAPVRDGEVICANHGAMFDADSGLCTYGPSEGAYLNELAVRVADGGVYLADDDYEYVADGPIDTDDDLSSSSNVIL